VTLGAGRLFGQSTRLAQSARLTHPHIQSPIVYACVRVNADSFAAIPWRVALAGDAETDVDPGHPVWKLLDRPNALMGGAKLRRAISSSLDYAGGVFLFLATAEGKPIAPGAWPAAIWPIRDDLVEPVREGTSPVPVAWKTSNGAEPIIFPDHAVAHIHYPDPSDPFRGCGPMQAAWRSADHLFRVEAFDDGLVEHGGQIGGVFTHDNRAMDPDERKALESRIAQNHSRPQHDRKKMILPAGISFTPTSWSPVDMQAEKMRKEKRDEIARTFGVPPVMLGALEDANRSSLRELRRVYYENTVIPRADFVVEEIAIQLIPKLPKEAQRVTVLLDYAQTAAMREDADSQIARMEKLVALGVPTNEAARIAGITIEGVPDGERWIRGNLRPADAAASEGLEDPDEDEDPDAEEIEPDEPEPEKSVTRSADARRRSIAEVEEKRLRRSDNRIAAGARKVFREMVDAQIAKLHEIAARAAGAARSVGEWDLLPTFAHWSRSTHAYAEALDLVPTVGSAGIVTVRGIEEDELERLLIAAQKSWGEDLWTAIKGAIAGAIEDAAKAAQKGVGGELVTVQNREVLRYLSAKQIQIVEGPTSVVAARIKRILAQALSEGTSTAVSLADRVREGLEGMVDSLEALRDQLGTRAMMIARTESAGASNTARVEQFKAAGVVQHEWITAGDDLVRDGHQIDGEITIVGEHFSNGMRKPHEEGAPAASVVNCRCLTSPVLPDA
jgi:HK97 family phage portal protein